jgi:hypothetical protein
LAYHYDPWSASLAATLTLSGAVLRFLPCEISILLVGVTESPRDAPPVIAVVPAVELK